MSHSWRALLHPLRKHFHLSSVQSPKPGVIISTAVKVVHRANYFDSRSNQRFRCIYTLGRVRPLPQQLRERLKQRPIQLHILVVPTNIRNHRQLDGRICDLIILAIHVLHSNDDHLFRLIAILLASQTAPSLVQGFLTERQYYRNRNNNRLGCDRNC